MSGGYFMIKGKRKLILPYLLPAVILYISLFILPTIYGAFISLHSWSGFTEEMNFIGLENYSNIFKDPIYWMAFKNTILIVVVGGVFTLAIGFLYTAIMSQKVIGKKIIRAVIFFPNIIAPVAIAIIWNYLYRYDIGLFNSILSFFNVESVNWTSSGNIMSSAIVGIIWSSVGLYAIILLSGADKIPESIYESAKMEGASTFNIFFKITLPLIWDVISIAVVLWTINAMRLFDFLFAFGGATPPQGIWNLALYQFILGFGSRTSIYEVGYSSAIAITMIILVSVLILAFRKMFSREVYEL